MASNTVAGQPSNIVAGHQEGDAFAPMRKSPQDELAEFQLLKEKLAVANDSSLSAEAKAILGATSELERLEMAIINKLSTSEKYSQSTADYQVLCQLTGETTYIGIGKWLAAKIYKRKRAEYLYNQFAGNSTIDKLKAARPGQTFIDFLSNMFSSSS
jgi:hypothetical protein